MAPKRHTAFFISTLILLAACNGSNQDADLGQGCSESKVFAIARLGLEQHYGTTASPLGEDVTLRLRLLFLEPNPISEASSFQGTGRAKPARHQSTIANTLGASCPPAVSQQTIADITITSDSPFSDVLPEGVSLADLFFQNAETADGLIGSTMTNLGYLIETSASPTLDSSHRFTIQIMLDDGSVLSATTDEIVFQVD